jgi:hypothetical protein
MPRYRNDGSHALNYSDSGGPVVAPGEEFEHEIPPAQLATHLRMGVVSEVDPDIHVHHSREVFDALQQTPGARRASLPIVLDGVLDGTEPEVSVGFSKDDVVDRRRTP